MKATTTKKISPTKTGVIEKLFPVVAIGASAGGLEAMIELLTNLPVDTGMAFIYVQHLSPMHKSLLSEILSKKTEMMVQEIDDMDKIKPNNVFVIPYNKGIEVTDGHIKLIPRSESNVAISIDVLFSSLAEAQKERVIGVILSGSASDGTIGLKAIKQEGGLTFAQDDSAKFTSMPHSAIASGNVDFILSPKEIAHELGRLSKHPLIKIIGVKNGEVDSFENNDPDLKIILIHLHKVTGVDFSAYKMNTIKRRIMRRMLLNKITTLKAYATQLSQKSEEIDILYQDLLINVTCFFRDTDTHKFLKESILPKLLKNKKTGESLRIWIPACASGEEAYSIAMMLLEIQESKTWSVPVHIFATDLSAQAIDKARLGNYTKQELAIVSPKRIQRFFNKTNNGFRVNKAVRDMCVFATHNILHDPPFSRLDFISCCNLFIYLDIPAQKKAVNTFHYALNENGYLMLGKSENITQSSNLFTGFNKKYKIFTRKKNTGNRTLPKLLPRYTPQSYPDKSFPITSRNKIEQKNSISNFDLDNAIDTVLVAEFMPASVVINHQMEIIQFRGTTDFFLTHPKGKATFNILKMARPEIAFELRTIISKVIKSKQRIRKTGIEIKVNSVVKIISIEILPLQFEFEDPLLLILFTEQEQIEFNSIQKEDGRNNTLSRDRRIKKLELELAAAHADAIEIAQEQEAFTEELQSANEEIVSSNEELQTVNEELETSKEELESANEELTTTNQELQTRNDLLNEAYDYSEALFATIHEPMIVLDKNLRIKSANKTFYKIFNTTEELTEGMLLYDLGNRQWDIPLLKVLLEDILPRNSHFHNFEITHNFPVVGDKTMLLNARRIIQKMNQEELILLAFSDVTEVRKKAIELKEKENEILLMKINEEQKLRKITEESEKRYSMMLMKSPFAFALLKGENMVITIANDNIKQLWDKGAKIEGKPLIKILPELKDQEFLMLLNNVYTTGIPYFANESLAYINRKGKIEEKYFNFVYLPYKETDGTITGTIIYSMEVTEQVQSRQKIEESKKELLEAKLIAENSVKYKQQFLSNMSHEIRTPLNSILGFANVLLKSEKNAEQKEFLQAIESSGNSLNMLINDILDLAKVDSGKMVFLKQPFDLRKSIKSMLYSFDLKVKEKNIELSNEYDLNLPKILLGDSIRLNQIVLNLLSNAVKFTHKGKIVVSVKKLNEDENNINIQFSISDTGIGISKSKISSIFNLFEQAELNTANSYGGTGLGLAIVKQLIKAQNGSINVSSKLGEGSIFSFILPFGKTNINLVEEVDIVKIDSNIKNLRVLVAEDIALNQLLIKIILGDFGMEYDIVGNGKLAVEKLQTDTYDLILMDLQMPIMNGFEATEYIRKTLKSKIPIIALTADVTKADITKSKEYGMDDYISKPFNEIILYNKITDLIKIRQ